MIPFDTQDRELAEVLKKCAWSTYNFERIFMKESFFDSYTEYHKRILEKIDDETIPKLAVCGYRGLGKSTHCLAAMAKRICFRQVRFIVYLESTWDLASEKTEMLKDELMTNPRISEVFNFKKGVKMNELKSSFARKGWMLSDPTTNEPIVFVIPKGMRQKVRGMVVRVAGRVYRPDFILGDDLQDDEEVLNPDVRRAQYNWLIWSLLQCVPETRPSARTNRWPKPKAGEWKAPWRVMMLDTFKHDDAIMARLLADPEWVSMRLPQGEAVKSGEGATKRVSYVSLVPERISTAQLTAEGTRAKASGVLDGWYREKLCLPCAPGEQSVLREHFRYFRDSDEKLGTRDDVYRVIIVDWATTTTDESDSTAILSAAIDCPRARLWFRRQLVGKWGHEEMIQQVYDLAVQQNAFLLCPETGILGEYLQQLFINERSIRKLWNVDFEWMTGHEGPVGSAFGSDRDAKKRARASMIVPYYRRGQVFHEESLRGGALEEGLLKLPRPTRWDAIDTGGYVPLVMQRRGWAFLLPEDPMARFFNKDSEEERRIGRMMKSGSWRAVV